MSRTPRQRAASRKNLEKARAARARQQRRKIDARGLSLKDRQFALPGSKFVSLGVVKGKARLRPVTSESSSVIRSFKLKPSKSKGNADKLRNEYEGFLKGSVSFLKGKKLKGNPNIIKGRR